ncbi:MAG: DUF4236 domain-containing protein [Clostridiales bacterium]|nr:DUF4236 domain-containing protein [Clostridiales bacterium]
MGMRFRKSVKIGKGSRVNFGKRGVSVSFGGRGLRHTVSTSGRRTTSVGIPGTGLSYTSTSGGGKSRSSKRRSSSSNRSYQAEVARQQREAEKAAEYERNCKAVDDFNDRLDEIRSIHQTCSDSVDWQTLKIQPEPFPKGEVGPLEADARAKFLNYSPSLLGKVFKSVDDRKREKLEADIRAAKQADSDNYSDWENLRTLAGQILDGGLESHLYAITEMHPFDDILEFGSDFDAGTDSPDFIEIEFHVKSAQVVPAETLSLTKTGKLSRKAMTKTMHYDIVQDYVCSCALRVAREIFAILPVGKVAIHAVDAVADDSTGKAKDETVLSVLIQRQDLAEIDFDKIDPSDTLEAFRCNMKFKKTKGLLPVERVCT